MSTQQISDGQIAEAAFYLWLEEGQPNNCAEDHWHRARAALETAPAPRKRRAPAKKAAAPKAKAAAPKAKADPVKAKAKAPAKRTATKARAKAD